MLDVKSLAALRRVTIVAPHSDDETIAAYTLISDLRRQSTLVTIIVVTDGHASHRRSRTWPKARLVAERRRETLRAAATAGVPRDYVRFLGFPDGGLDSLIAVDRRRLQRALARGRRPDLVIMPDPQDAHPDHRDVAQACLKAWPPHVPKLAYGVWTNDGATPPRDWARVSRLARPARKRRVLRLYRTQTGLITDDPQGFHLTHEQIRTMCGPFEQFTVL